MKIYLLNYKSYILSRGTQILPLFLLAPCFYCFYYPCFYRFIESLFLSFYRLPAFIDIIFIVFIILAIGQIFSPMVSIEWKESAPPLTFKFFKVKSHVTFGAIAQLGERYVRNVEVEGSTPFCSTSILIL